MKKKQTSKQHNNTPQESNEFIKQSSTRKEMVRLPSSWYLEKYFLVILPTLILSSDMKQKEKSKEEKENTNKNKRKIK